MLTLNEKRVLTIENETIVSPDTLLHLKAPEAQQYLGVLKMQNGVSKVFPFIENGDEFLGRLILVDEDVMCLEGSTLQLQVVTPSGQSAASNGVALTFDLPTIRLLVKRRISSEILDLSTQVAVLEGKLDAIMKNHRLLGIVVANPAYIRKGMMLVAIDDKGSFVAEFPFTDIVKTVNGTPAVGNEISLRANNIPYSETTNVQTAIESLRDAVLSISTAVAQLTTQQADLTRKVSQMEIDLTTHLANTLL